MRGFLGVVLILACLAGAARAEMVNIPLEDGTQLQAELSRPAQPSALPAVVLLHGCGGPFPARDNPWRNKFLAEGRIVLKPLSFASRGLGSQCKESVRRVPADTVRRDDTIAAAKWLTAQTDTPPGGVVVMGWSNGGETTLAAATAMPDGLVRAYIAFYPGCRTSLRRTNWAPRAPMLILIGASDDWTPAAPCRELAARFTPEQLRLVVYPGAYHDFDAPSPVRVREGMAFSQNADKSVHAGRNEAAATDAVRQVDQFLSASGK